MHTQSVNEHFIDAFTRIERHFTFTVRYALVFFEHSFFEINARAAFLVGCESQNRCNLWNIETINGIFEL